MACRVPLGHLAVMDVTEPKEIRAAREKLGPRGQLVQKERKEIKESLEPRAPLAKKDSEGQKGQRGEKGESGTPGSPQLSSHMNWKECTWKKEDSKDSGVIQASGKRHEHAMY